MLWDPRRDSPKISQKPYGFFNILPLGTQKPTVKPKVLNAGSKCPPPFCIEKTMISENLISTRTGKHSVLTAGAKSAIQKP